jgi:beta-glucosidase
MSGELGQYLLSAIGIDLIKDVCDAFHSQGKKVVLVLNISGIIQLTEVVDFPNAILLSWQCGQDGGNIAADVLSGKANPSGKLPTIFFKASEDCPAKNFPGSPSKVIYDESIFVGYRYCVTFGIAPLFPFGFGLSYTTFSFSEASLQFSSDIFNLVITVTNTGSYPGKEVVQIYVSAPQIIQKSKKKSSKDLQKQSYLLQLKKKDFQSKFH